MQKETWAVIPAHNEAANIGSVVERAKNNVDIVLVVDDGSDDDTRGVAEEKGAFVLRHIINLGKGAALKTGCDYAYKKGADMIVILDADGQHDPAEINKLIEHLDGNDIVFTYRKIRKEMPFVFKMGNFFIRTVTKFLFKVKVKDSQCGFRAFTSEAYRKMRWTTAGYAVENEIIANVGKNKLRYTEVPIKTIYTDSYKGTTVVDGIKIVLNMFWWKLTK